MMRVIRPRLTKNFGNALTFVWGALAGSFLAFLAFYELNIDEVEEFVGLKPTEITPKLDQKILCVVSIHSNNLKQMDAVYDTFAPRCDDIIYYASRLPSKPKIRVNKKGKTLPPEGNYTRWIAPGALTLIKNKEPGTWEFVQEVLKDVALRHVAGIDWVMAIDDHSFVIMENLRHLISTLDPSLPHFLGNRVHSTSLIGAVLPFLRSDYLQRKSGYLISRKAFELLYKSLDDCQGVWFPSCEDTALSKCFRTIGVSPADAVDREGGGHYFLSETIRTLIPKSSQTPTGMFFPSLSSGSPCCSDRAVVFGDLSFKDIRLIEYTVYSLRPLGHSQHTA